jgi:hypothetical protein
MPAEDIPRFLEGSTLAAIHAGATWFTWWASHDIDRHFTVNPLEYSLGLLDCDNREKPAAETFRRLAKEWRGAAQIAQPNPSVAASVDSHATTWAWLEAWLAQPR